MKSLMYVFGIVIMLNANAQPPGGDVSTQNEYDKGHIKDRSAKAHKETDRTNEKNVKAQDKANKQAEKNRKEKLSGKKKKDDQHKFNF